MTEPKRNPLQSVSTLVHCQMTLEITLYNVLEYSSTRAHFQMTAPENVNVLEYSIHVQRVTYACACIGVCTLYILNDSIHVQRVTFRSARVLSIHVHCTFSDDVHLNVTLCTVLSTHVHCTFSDD